MNEQTDTSRTLGGDITLQQLESRIRTAVFMQVNTTYGPKRLGDLGVTFQKDGSLKFDKAVMESALSTNFDMVAQVLTGSYSLEGGKVKGSLDYLTDMTEIALQMPNGLLPNRKRGIQSNIDQIDRQIVNKERHIAQKEEMLKRKFARLEETMSKIRSSGAGLAGMANAAGMGAVQQIG
jgi:flagellar hook-associated protein 2